MVPSGFTEAAPLLGPLNVDVTVGVPPSGSESLANTVMLTAESSLVVAESSFAMGSLLTVTLTAFWIAQRDISRVSMVPSNVHIGSLPEMFG